MNIVTLGSTGITTVQNAFGALPIQRIPEDDAVALVRKAYEGGMTYFDTARAYSNSEERLGKALHDVRDKVFIASKTMAKTPEDFWSQLQTTLTNLQTDYLDIHQFHCAEQVYAPGDGTGMYECMLQAKEQGKIRHIGITAHKLGVAQDAVASGLYETLQYPFSYLTGQEEIDLVESCERASMGFIAMKAVGGGLITNGRAAMAFMQKYPNVLPIWGVQRQVELDEWLSYMDDQPVLTPEIEEVIAADRRQLQGEFCRGCGYCMPCPSGIMINQAARISLMLRRAPSQYWLGSEMQAEMAKVDDCTECGICRTRCPYNLDIPNLLKRNLADYRSILKGETAI